MTDTGGATNTFSGFVNPSGTVTVGNINAPNTIEVYGDITSGPGSELWSPVTLHQRQVVGKDDDFTITLTPVTNSIKTLRVDSGSGGKDVPATPYSGPVTGIDWQYLGSNASRKTITGTSDADFINGLAGDDIIYGAAGNDILDGGVGSNFLSGETGTDIFFTDARDGQVGWSTIVDFIPGVEQVTIWGFQPGVSRVFWEDNYGAEGYKGATAFFDMDGSSQTDRSGVDFAVTFSGHSVSELGPSYQLDGLMWFRPTV